MAPSAYEVPYKGAEFVPVTVQRQVAAIVECTEEWTGMTVRAMESPEWMELFVSCLLTGTAPGDPWEQAVTNCLTALCCRAAGQDVNVCVAGLVNMYLGHDAKPGLIVFDIRLGLTVLDVIDSADQRAVSLLVEELVRRTTEARNGYAAREVLAHPLFLALTTDSQTRDCKDLVRTCALDAGALPEEAYRDLSTALDRSETVLNSSVTSATPRTLLQPREVG
ncbi:hypothetical protein [Streptomyces hokutonensis]|uniref:Uncharacterized protein n=1 Tax=Streptomyces hokutonensis TaxID=1306990 RepID=A0ABW6MG39_9ACTN